MQLSFEEDTFFDRYADNRATGSFVLIDPDTLNTVAGGMVTDLAPASKQQSIPENDRVTLNLPRDLASLVMGHELLADRLHEVELVELVERV